MTKHQKSLSHYLFTLANKSRKSKMDMTWINKMCNRFYELRK